MKACVFLILAISSATPKYAWAWGCSLIERSDTNTHWSISLLPGTFGRSITHPNVIKSPYSRLEPPPQKPPGPLQRLPPQNADVLSNKMLHRAGLLEGLPNRKDELDET